VPNETAMFICLSRVSPFVALYFDFVTNIESISKLPIEQSRVRIFKHRARPREQLRATFGESALIRRGKFTGVLGPLVAP